MLVVDTRERPASFRALFDEERLLVYGDQNFSFDILIERHDGELRVERKTAKDFVGSFRKGSFLRQLSAVDVLIVEGPQSREFYRPEDRKLWEGACQKVLARLALSIPVIRSRSPAETVRLCRYLESRPDLSVRESRIASGQPDFVSTICEGLGLNPLRLTPEGHLRDAVAARIDMEAIRQAINLERLSEIPGIGPKAAERARARLDT